VRGLRLLGRGLGTSALFVGSLAGGAVAHLDVPAVRRLTVARVNAALASAMAGKIVIDRIGSAGTTEVSGVDAHVEDPSGRTVLRVEGLSARVDTAGLVRSLVVGGDVRVDVEELSLAKADVDLDADGDTLRLARAFAAPKPSSPGGGGGGVRVSLGHAHLGHVVLHGQPPGAPRLDAEIDDADVGLALVPGSVALDLRHARVTARGLPPGATSTGTLDGHLGIPGAGGTGIGAHATWAGTMGAVPVHADATYDPARVDAVVDVPSTTPEDLRTLWAAAPFGDDVAAHVEAHGALSSLQVDTRASVGRGTITVAGPVSVGDELHAALKVTARAVDLHALAASAPPSDLGATAQVDVLRHANGAANATVALVFDGGTIDAARVPPAKIDARGDVDASGAIHAQADVTAAEPGAPAHATVRLAPHGSSFEIAFDATADVARLDAVPRLGPGLQGAAHAHAKGTLDLDTMRVAASADATLASLRAGKGGAVSLGSASLTAKVQGPVSSPAVDADLTGDSLRAGPLRFETLHAQVAGPPTHAPVKVSLHGHGADFFARADVDLRGGAALHDLLVTMDRGGESVRAKASLVRIAGSASAVEGLELDGLGAPLHATVRIAPSAVDVRAESRGLDLVRLGRLAGLEGVGGRLSLDVDAELRSSSAKGHVSLDLAQGSFAGWRDASAHVDATLDGRKASGKLEARVADIGSVEVTSSSVEVGEDPLRAASWRGAWGAADVAAHVDLARLVAHLPPGTLPAARIAGSVDVKGRVGRDSASDDSPEVDVTAATHELAITGSPIPWHVDGIGAQVHVQVDGKTARTTLAAELADAAGNLLSLTASSDAVPYRQLFDTDESPRDALLAMPFTASLALPDRDVASLPAILGTRGMHGRVAATVGWRGSARAPAVDLHATLAHGKADSAVFALPVDLDVTGRYDGARATTAIEANVHEKKVLDATAAVDVRAADVLGVGGGDVPWTGSAHATLSDFPLQSVGPLDNRQVRGRASGTLALDGLHRDAHATLAITLEDLAVGDVACLPSVVNVTADGHALDFTARIDEKDGSASAKAHAGLRWGAALAPSLDPSQPAEVSLAAKRFRTAVLLPFVSQTFTEFDGRVDGAASVAIDPSARSMKPSGTLQLTDGVFEVSSLGNELHDAKATLTMTPDGVVKLENARAKGLTGHVEAAATARFQGFELAGAKALVQVPRKDPIPLVVDGVSQGLFDGRMDVTVQQTKDALDVAVDVPTMRLQLPLAATHDVQGLGTLAGVRVGLGQGGGFLPVTLDGGDAATVATGGPASPMRVSVHLGSAVEVKRGADLDVRLEGGPTITVADAVHAAGQIRIPSGSLDVEGKTFKIEQGTVTFVDDPSNPQIVLSASWVAGDGTTVYAEFVGPLKTGKVTLRSEPALGKDQILALLLYGTPDQDSGGATQGQQQLGAAGGVAGNAASEKLNRALGGVNQALDGIGLQGGISTKLDTSQTTPRPEVEVQIARDISLQVAWVLGVPPPGSNPDTHLFTVSWRFLRQWQLETTVGDAGTSILDLVWQHRY
jgi:translocation and assembly module TamB